MEFEAVIWVGTSGFQYPEWKGSFYPEKLSLAKMLPYYAARFPTTEINYSFRRIPSEKTLTNWRALTPEQFRFGMKALQEITHVRRLRDCSGILAKFCEALQVLGEKLGPVLFQLPPFLRREDALLEDFLAIIPGGLRCAFEFRHESWFADETFAALKSKNAALCVADTETLSTPAVVTADFGYFRLRKPDYGKTEISRWTKIIGKQSKAGEDVFVYFRHEETGSGPKFAQQLMKELGIAGVHLPEDIQIDERSPSPLPSPPRRG